jgi:hypothetical protein
MIHCRERECEYCFIKLRVHILNLEEYEIRAEQIVCNFMLIMSIGGNFLARCQTPSNCNYILTLHTYLLTDGAEPS